MKYKIKEKLLLQSKDGNEYIVVIININDFREPSAKYGLNVYDKNNTIYDFVFVCEDYLDNYCKKIGE